MSSNSGSIDPNYVEIKEENWDFYSGMPNPKWYEKSQFSSFIST